MDYVLMITTLETRAAALELANELVHRRLAACAQVVGPITSVYHWQGKQEQSEEYRCELKTRRDLMNQVEQVIARVHPYDVPELVTLSFTHVAENYAHWLDGELLGD